MTTLLIDFDGVINIEMNLRQYKRAYRGDENRAGNPDLFQDAWALSVPYNGFKQRVTFSTELVKALNTLRGKHHLKWVWLTTWESQTYYVDKRLHTASDSYIRWDFTDLDTRNANKYAEFLKLTRAGEKVIWIDDEATVLYDPNDVPDASNVLVVKPDPNTGLTRSDVASIASFLS